MPANDDLVHGWVSTDCGRGTSDILWSCLATIFLCVWTVIHLPVPYYREQRSLSLRQRLVRSGIGPALISVIVPEFLAITAVCEMTTAWEGKREIKRLTQVDWTLTHQFFLAMGGVCLRSPSGRHVQIAGKNVVEAMETSHGHGKQTPDWVSELEKLTKGQIEDLAKSDALSKLIACGQALWLVTQVVSRLFQHQAVTLLEISTCAYVSCALLSYAAWWHKPQGCVSPIMISCSDAVSEILSHVSEDYYYKRETRKDFIWAGRRWFSVMESGRVVIGSLEDWVTLSLTGLCPSLFGAIHVASWNIRLPSDVELWIWRASSIYCLTVGVIVVVMMLLYLGDILAFWFYKPLELSIYFLCIVYIIVRIFMIVEVFLSLRALPHSAYESVQWSSFVPHV